MSEFGQELEAATNALTAVMISKRGDVPALNDFVNALSVGAVRRAFVGLAWSVADLDFEDDATIATGSSTA